MLRPGPVRGVLLTRDPASARNAAGGRTSRWTAGSDINVTRLGMTSRASGWTLNALGSATPVSGIPAHEASKAPWGGTSRSISLRTASDSTYCIYESLNVDHVPRGKTSVC